MGFQERCREPHHPDEGRPHAPSLQGRTYGRSQERHLLAAEIRKADEADPETLVDSVMEAQNNLKEAGSQTQIEDVAAAKGYHASHTLELSEAVGLRTYNPEPRRPHRLRGLTSRRNLNTSTLIGGGSSGPRASGGSAAGANCASAPLLTCAIVAAYAEVALKVSRR